MSGALTQLQRRHTQIAFRSNQVGDKMADRFDVIDDAGVIVNATLVMSSQPTAADTIDIGADTYEFQAAAADLADDANIAVEIGGSAAATLTNLVAAINAVDPDDAHPTIFQTDSTTPALANGTEKVTAIESGTSLVIFGANEAGGQAIPSSPDILLAEAITAAANIWEEGNVNLNTLGGQAAASRQHATGELTITAAMLTKGSKFIALPFAPTHIRVQVLDSTNAVRPSGTDVYAPSGDGFTVTFGGGGSPDIQATDKLRFVALS